MKILFFFHLFIPLISAFFFNKNEYVEMKKYFIRKNIDIVDDKLYYYLNIRLKLSEEIGLKHKMKYLIQNEKMKL